MTERLPSVRQWQVMVLERDQAAVDDEDQICRQGLQQPSSVHDRALRIEETGVAEHTLWRYPVAVSGCKVTDHDVALSEVSRLITARRRLPSMLEDCLLGVYRAYPV